MVRGEFNFAYLRSQECRRLKKNFRKRQSTAEVAPQHPEAEGLSRCGDALAKRMGKLQTVPLILFVAIYVATKDLC
eukprot:30565-Amphidinium_carterae.1